MQQVPAFSTNDKGFSEMDLNFFFSKIKSYFSCEIIYMVNISLSLSLSQQKETEDPRCLDDHLQMGVDGKACRWKAQEHHFSKVKNDMIASDILQLGKY